MTTLETGQKIQKARTPAVKILTEQLQCLVFGDNRALTCLVAIELKIDTFRPEHLGQLNFYLEALDRDVKKPNENPSVGLVLCTGKDDTVVEYALSRSMSPTMVADYTLHLPDKAILQSKLRELTELALEGGEDDEGDEE